MGSLYLVRHGQASLGAVNYDQLSALGVQQCHHLGAYFASHGTRFAAVYTGTLMRHAQSLAAVAEGFGQPLVPQVRAGLDEYKPESLVRAVHSGELPQPGTPEANKQHFRLLRTGLLAWMQGETVPADMPAYPDFLAGALAVLAEAHAHPHGDVLIVSSGGPISALVGHLLGATATGVVELNLRIRNSAVTELQSHAKGHGLISFNGLPHLDTVALRSLHSYA